MARSTVRHGIRREMTLLGLRWIARRHAPVEGGRGYVVLRRRTQEQAMHDLCQLLKVREELRLEGVRMRRERAARHDAS